MAGTSAKQARSGLERFLGAFTDVRGGEGISALLLTLNVFLLLAAYYIIKPVRDALIAAMPGGAEYKSYMGGAIAVALLFAVPAYSAYAKRVQRNRLVVGVTLFFASHLLLFAIATRVPGNASWLPLVFFLWVGIFNMMLVAQFWAFANDIYNEEQGKRLFALVGIGASAGAAAGGALAKWLPVRPVSSLAGDCSAETQQQGYLGTLELLVLAAAILGVCAFITQVVHRRESSATKKKDIKKQLQHTMAADVSNMKEKIEKFRLAEEAKKKSDGGAFELVFRYRYLLLLAIFSLVFTLVNTNGEYMITKLVKKLALETVGQCALTDDAVKKTFIDGLLTSWYGDFYFYVNVAGVLLQSFAVSRLVKWGGVKLAFFVMPVVVALGATALLVLPFIAVVRAAKIAENATDYSINNTVRNMLWLPTTKAMKYRAKQAVDTFFVRMGDVGSALIVLLITQVVGFNPGDTDPGIHTLVRIFAAANLALVAVWLFVATRIVKEQDTLKRMRESGQIEDD